MISYDYNTRFELKFIIYLIIFEILFRTGISLIDIKGFAAIPYIRIGILLFTTAFFLKKILLLKIVLKKKSRFFYEELLIVCWVLFALTHFITGVFRSNPTVYLFTDFIYIIFGVVLYYANCYYTKSNFLNQNKLYSRLSNLTIILSIICVVFNFRSPTILLVLMCVLIYINITQNNFLKVIFLLIPYFILLSSSNRTQLIVFGLMLLVLFLKKFRKKFSINGVILFSLITLSILFFFKENMVEFILFLSGKQSNIGYRFQQILLIFQNGIDYSDPFFTSIVQRILESKAVINYWLTDLWTFIFGAGSGGVIDGSKIYTDNSVLGSALLGAKQVHNIHILPFALIFRYGVMGLIIFMLLLKIAFESFVLIINEKNNLDLIFWNMFVVFWICFSIPASSFLWTMPVFWVALSKITYHKSAKKDE